MLEDLENDTDFNGLLGYDARGAVWTLFSGHHDVNPVVACGGTVGLVPHLHRADPRLAPVRAPLALALLPGARVGQGVAVVADGVNVVGNGFAVAAGAFQEGWPRGAAWHVGAVVGINVYVAHLY